MLDGFRIVPANMTKQLNLSQVFPIKEGVYVIEFMFDYQYKTIMVFTQADGSYEVNDFERVLRKDDFPDMFSIPELNITKEDMDDSFELQ